MTKGTERVDLMIMGGALAELPEGPWALKEAVLCRKKETTA